MLRRALFQGPLSLDPLDDGRVRLGVDFSHEICLLDLTVDSKGRITHIDADLE